MQGISGPFDLALDMGCFHGVDDRESYLRELRGLLALGGHWLMYGIISPLSKEIMHGLAESDLDLVKSYGLHQISRMDSFDKRNRPSAWFLFQRTGSGNLT